MIIKEITSIQNPHMKHLRSLEKSKYRKQEGQFVIEGIRMMEEVFEAGITLDAVFYSLSLLDTPRGEALFSALQKMPLPGYLISDQLMKQAGFTETPQGVIGIISQLHFSLEELLARENPVFLMLHQIQDPGNLGTLIRTADAAGITGVVLTQGTVDLYNPKTIRATMGSIFHLPVLIKQDAIETIKAFQNAKIQVVAAALGTNTYFYEVDFARPTVIIVGNEGQGLPEEILQRVDMKVKIPIPGKAESLNAAIAGGILLYEAVRSRQRTAGRAN